MSDNKEDLTRKHIRGSSLLLSGRMFALAVNFAVQILTVRYLAKSDYGALAYALSVVSMGASLTLLGLDKTLARFVPIYQEQNEFGKSFGSIVLAIGSIIGIGLALVGLTIGLRSVLLGLVVNDPLSLALLLIVIALSPITALDSLFQTLLAIFARPRAIFFRRHVLGPGLKLIVVVLIILTQSNVQYLALGYVVGGLLGLVTNAAMLVHVVRKHRLIQPFKFRDLSLPAGEIFGFTLPLLSSDVVFLLRNNLIVVFLELFKGTTSVAEFRAVVPVARLNLVVLESFTFLYTPMAARLFARQDKTGLDELFWRTATWITIITFPVFLVTFSLAQPLTVLLFGSRYAQSASILSILAFGYFLNAALGFNTYTLRVYKKVGFIVAIDFLTAIVGLGANLVLIPRYGAPGAAIGTTATLVTQNLLNHIGLHLFTDVKLFKWYYLRIYLTVALGAIGLLLFQVVVSPPVYVGLALTVALSLLVVGLNRAAINATDMFPELRRFPLIGRFLES